MLPTYIHTYIHTLQFEAQLLPEQFQIFFLFSRILQVYCTEKVEQFIQAIEVQLRKPEIRDTLDECGRDCQ